MTTAAAGKGQGGGPFPCLGLPGGSEPAWVLNITVTNSFTAPGGLKAWAFGSSEPNASVVNWLAGQNGAIANGATVIGCFGCADDITVKTFGDSAHVIIDVMGYYRAAGVSAAAVTRLAGDVNVLVTAGVTLIILGGICPAGTVLNGGEVSGVGGLWAVNGSYTGGFGRWQFEMRNEDSLTRSVSAWSRCMDTPIHIS